MPARIPLPSPAHVDDQPPSCGEPPRTGSCTHPAPGLSGSFKDEIVQVFPGFKLEHVRRIATAEGGVADGQADGQRCQTQGRHNKNAEYAVNDRKRSGNAARHFAAGFVAGFFACRLAGRSAWRSSGRCACRTARWPRRRLPGRSGGWAAFGMVGGIAGCASGRRTYRVARPAWLNGPLSARLPGWPAVRLSAPLSRSARSVLVHCVNPFFYPLAFFNP